MSENKPKPNGSEATKPAFKRDKDTGRIPGIMTMGDMIDDMDRNKDRHKDRKK